jgi:hypothetical protein
MEIKFKWRVPYLKSKWRETTGEIHYKIQSLKRGIWYIPAVVASRTHSAGGR